MPSPVAAIAQMLPGAGVRREVADLRQQVSAERNNTEMLAESVAELERQLLDPGWMRILQFAEQEFSAEGLVQLRAICRLFAIKNPLIKRGLNLRSAYVWGQGVEITARSNGRRAAGEQDVQAVVAGFLTDPATERSWSGAEARDQLEHALGEEGEIFAALFTAPVTGQVQIRTLSPDEISDIICNPEDNSEPWYYRRCWTQITVDPASGARVYTPKQMLYPAIDYRPQVRPRYIGEVPIAWDAPLLHIAVNRPRGWHRGIPDAYAAIDWARAYKEFLEDWARLMRSLSRYAWKATVPGRAAGQVRTRLADAATRSQVTGEPLSAGATALLSPDAALEAINKSGATIDAESGRPLAMMVASALDVPVTMLLADPGQTGARATAETLDQPTELAMAQRRDVWAAAYQRILRYVIAESVRAPQGALKGTILRDRYGRETVTLAGDTDATIDVVWPDLDDTDPAALVEAVTKAAATGVMPPELILRLLLTALGVRHVDELVEVMLDDDGRFIWPQAPPIGSGQAAADAMRGGGDPTDHLPGGSMSPEPGDEPSPEPGDTQP
jgi:hypothetical protein